METYIKITSNEVINNVISVDTPRRTWVNEYRSLEAAVELYTAFVSALIKTHDPRNTFIELWDGGQCILQCELNPEK